MNEWKKIVHILHKMATFRVAKVKKRVEWHYAFSHCISLASYIYYKARLVECKEVKKLLLSLGSHVLTINMENCRRRTYFLWARCNEKLYFYYSKANIV